MAALNHAVMIPGLVVIVILFWAWIPIWAIIWCMRRANGKNFSDAELQAGHVPHKGFEPPEDFDYMPYVAPNQLATAPLRKESLHHNGHYSSAAHMEWNGEKPAIKTDVARRQRQEEKQAAAQKEQERRDRRERQERREKHEMRERERERDARRKEKGKEHAHSVSDQTMSSHSAVTAPEQMLTRDSRRHHSRH